MPQGLQTFDRNSNLLLDYTDRVTRLLGEFVVPVGASGSIVNDGFLTGQPFAICIRTNAGYPTFANNTMNPPSINFNGNVMTYSNQYGDHLIKMFVF